MASNDDHSALDSLTLTVRYQSQDLIFTFPIDATVADLSRTIAADLDISISRQKILVAPSPGLLRPDRDGSKLLSSLDGYRSIVLLGTSNTTKTALDSALHSHNSSSSPSRRALAPRVTAYKYRSPTSAAEQRYTFAAIQPLPYLPRPERSAEYLTRLANDPGIKYVMRTKQLAVGLLTEMDPAAHTTHESRTLGLNRNRGEIIELRLRTDAYDGYRDYKTIRRTLCHELTHNVFGDHDAAFWKLCGEIERVVERNDWSTGGRMVGESAGFDGFAPASAPVADGEVHDHGGWTGGEYVLGSGPVDAVQAGQTGTARRDVIARAADARLKKQKELERPAEQDPPGQEDET